MGRLCSLTVLDGWEPTQRDGDRRSGRREVIDRLRARQDLLDAGDRGLLKGYLEAGSSFDELARLAGTSRSAMCRRVHRVIHRLCDETYVRCAADPERFPAAELAVIRDYFVRGLPLTRICREHRLYYRRARALVDKAYRFARENRTE
ncbi:MAG: hypothetical protein FJ280_05360 [Planctomycetes bacterium]|nr:hypothetical protein [Planctomycetota bacterium]